jgi:hypothetical protein
MKTLILVLCSTLSLALNAQLTPQPIGYAETKKDFEPITKAGYTKCNMYNKGEDYLVKSITYQNGFATKEYNCAPSSKQGQELDTTEIISHYPKAGKAHKREIFTVENGETAYEAWKYNRRGLPSEKLIATIDPPTYYYTYNAKSHLQEILVKQYFPAADSAGNPYTVQIATYKYVFTCNAQERVTQERMYNLRNEPAECVSTRKFAYNAQGQLTQCQLYNSENKLEWEQKFNYSKKNLLVSSTYFNVFDDDKVEYIYKYE